MAETPLGNGDDSMAQSTAYGLASGEKCSNTISAGLFGGSTRMIISLTALRSVLTTPNQVKMFYKDSHTHIKSSDNNAGWLFAELLGQCVGVVSKKRWKRVRGHFEAHFSRSVSVRRTEQFLSEAKDFVGSLGPLAHQKTIDPAVDLKYCPFFMVAGILFGKLTAGQRKRLYDISPGREELFRKTFTGGVNRFKITKYLPGSALSDLRSFQKDWETFVQDAAAQIRCAEHVPIRYLYRAVQDDELSMSELLQTLDESLFANLDVTTHALAWVIISLAQHKSIQHEVWLEIEKYAMIPAQYEDYLRRDASLLSACVVESSRLHPILPFSNPESATEDKVIEGFFIPRKTDVIVDTYAINVDNPYWERAKEYDPYRHFPSKDQARRYQIWRFGFGPRQCLGKNIADTIVRVIVAELLKKYRLELEEAEESDLLQLQEDSWIGLPVCNVRLIPRMTH